MYDLKEVTYVEDIVNSLTVDDLVEFLNSYDLYTQTTLNTQHLSNDVVGLVDFFNEVYLQLKPIAGEDNLLEIIEEALKMEDEVLPEIDSKISLQQTALSDKYMGRLCRIIYDRQEGIYSEKVYEVCGTSVDEHLNIEIDALSDITDSKSLIFDTYTLDDLYFLSKEEIAGLNI